MLVERTLCRTPPRATPPPRAVTRRIAPERKIQIVGTSHSAVSDELEHARRAWTRYQSTRKRDAVYGYLTAVFEIVQHWKKQHRAKVSSHQALVATKQRRAIRTDDPFAVVIFCYVRFRDCRRQDYVEMVPGFAIRPKGKARQSAPDRFH